MTSRNTFVERCNDVRKRIPFAYWIAYDLVGLPLMIYVAWNQVWWAYPVALMWSVAVFFDVNEAIVKWNQRDTCVLNKS